MRAVFGAVVVVVALSPNALLDTLFSKEMEGVEQMLVAGIAAMSVFVTA